MLHAADSMVLACYMHEALRMHECCMRCMFAWYQYVGCWQSPWKVVSAIPFPYPTHLPTKCCCSVQEQVDVIFKAVGAFTPIDACMQSMGVCCTC